MSGTVQSTTGSSSGKVCWLNALCFAQLAALVADQRSSNLLLGWQGHELLLELVP